MKLTKIYAVIAATVIGSSAIAVPIDGTLEYNLDTSDFSFDSTSLSFPAPPSGKVNDLSGDFVGPIALGADVSHAPSPFVYSPFAVLPFGFTVDGGLSFALTELIFADFDSKPGFSAVTLFGRGIASLAGFDDTEMTWSFSADSNSGVFNYSATLAPVPARVTDGGTTLVSLGLALFAVATFSRMRSKRSIA